MNSFAVVTLLLGAVWSDYPYPQVPRPTTTSTSAPAITTGNTALQVNRNQWNWWTYILGDNDALSAIQCVEYVLHPTFPDPVKTVCDRGAQAGMGFVLAASGWGTFTINITVRLKNGETKYLKHDLQFDHQMEGWRRVGGTVTDTRIDVSGPTAEAPQLSFDVQINSDPNGLIMFKVATVSLVKPGGDVNKVWRFILFVNDQRVADVQPRQYRDSKTKIMRIGPRDGESGWRPATSGPRDIRIEGYKVGR